MTDLSYVTTEELIKELTTREHVTESSHNGNLDGGWLEMYTGRGIFTVILIEDAE